MKNVFILAVIISLVIFLLMVCIGFAEKQKPQTYQVIEVEPVPEPEPTTEPVPSFYYELTAAERDLVERVVMAEAGGEPYEGQLAVAQCILNACLLDGLRPAQVVIKYKYTAARPMPTEAVKMAVRAVFDKGEEFIDPEVKYFYAPNLAKSAWHESQVYVCTIGSHRFFKEAAVLE